MIIAIFGLGLIGGSIGKATLKKTEHTVLGYDVDENALIKAGLVGAISARGEDCDLNKADMVVLAVRPTAAVNILDAVVPKLKAGAIVFDCCGTKRTVVAEMEKLHRTYPELNFVGVHPMAGREFSGVEHATAGLFENSYFIMVPVHTDIAALVTVKHFFLSLGAEGVEVTTAAKHDEIIAYTSQLAHVVSSAYVQNPLSLSHAGFSAGSFRDMTRVARLNADMWTELFIENSDNLTHQIDDLIARMSALREAISNKDENRLNGLLKEGTEAKAAAETALKERRKND